MVSQYLIVKAIDRPPPLEKEIKAEFVDTLIEPFVTPAGACINALSAISLLNRYCMTLPVDKFTVFSVAWSQVENSLGTIVKVQLPMQSTVREPISVSIQFRFINWFSA